MATRIIDGTMESQNIATEGFELHAIGGTVTFSGSRFAHGSTSLRCDLNRTSLTQDIYRAEVYCANTNEFNNLQWDMEYWMGFNVYFENWADDWSGESVMQIHRRPSSWDITLNGGKGCGGQVSAYSVAPFYNGTEAGQLFFNTYGGITRFSTPIVTGQWHSIVWHFKLGWDASSYIEGWYNGVKRFTWIGPNHRQLDDCNQPWKAPYANFGIYKWDWRAGRVATASNRRTNYYDDVRLYRGTLNGNTQADFNQVYFPASNPNPIDTTPPIITSVSATNITSNSVTITWVTNEASDSRVDYGLTTGYGSNVVNTADVTSHSINITGLTAGTLYNYRVTSADPSNNSTASANFTFTTATVATDTIPPVISSILFNTTEDSVTCTYVTDEPATTRLKTISPASLSYFDAALVNNHTAVISNLTPGTTYLCKVSSADEAGNNAETAGLSFSTQALTPPIISDLFDSSTTDTITISWTTSKPCTSVVNYGTSNLYGSQLSSAVLTTTHSYTITGLTPNTLIHYQVSVTDTHNLTTTSLDVTIPTAQANPVVSNVASTPDITSCVITWSTDITTYGSVHYGSSLSLGLLSTATNNVTSHSITLTGLSASTTYYFKVRSSFADDYTETDYYSFTTKSITGISNDVFDGASLQTFWTDTDPAGDCTTSVSAGELSLSIPSGSTHDIWTTNKNGPRVLQSCGNVDFVLETKITTQPTANNAGVGIIAQQDSNNLIRAAYVYASSSLNIFLGGVLNGTGFSWINTATPSTTFPAYLRLERVGNSWRIYKSNNGSSWTWQNSATFNQAFNITSVGLHATTSSTNPAWLAKFDYFKDSSLPSSLIGNHTFSGTALDSYKGTAIWGDDLQETTVVSDQYLSTFTPFDPPLVLTGTLAEQNQMTDNFTSTMVFVDSISWDLKTEQSSTWENK